MCAKTALNTSVSLPGQSLPTLQQAPMTALCAKRSGADSAFWNLSGQQRQLQCREGLGYSGRLWNIIGSRIPLQFWVPCIHEASVPDQLKPSVSTAVGIWFILSLMIVKQKERERVINLIYHPWMILIYRNKEYHGIFNNHVTSKIGMFLNGNPNLSKFLVIFDKLTRFSFPQPYTLLVNIQ